MADDSAELLRNAGAKLYANPDRLLDDLAEAFLGETNRAAA